MADNKGSSPKSAPQPAREAPPPRATPVAASKPSERTDGTRDAARTVQRAEQARNFRELSQGERLQDKRFNSAAKAVAAMDAAIDKKYGADSKEAARMRAAAREGVGQAIDRGRNIPAPRVRDDVTRQVQAEQNRTAAERTAKDLER